VIVSPLIERGSTVFLVEFHLSLDFEVVLAAAFFGLGLRDFAEP
jgi:hypothetical protein